MRRLWGELRKQQSDMQQQQREGQERQRKELEKVMRIMTLNLENVEEVAREELQELAEEKVGELVQRAAEVPRPSEVEIPKTPAGNRSAKKSPVAKPKGVIAGIASALCRKWKGRFYSERKTLEKELLSFLKLSQKSRTPNPHSSKRPSEEARAVEPERQLE